MIYISGRNEGVRRVQEQEVVQVPESAFTRRSFSLSDIAATIQ